MKNYKKKIRAAKKNRPEWIGILNYLSVMEEESISDIVEFGADCGIRGLIYSADTAIFFHTFKAEIFSMCREAADNCGFNSIIEYAHQNLKGLAGFSIDEIAEAIHSAIETDDPDDDWHNSIVKNYFTWFAVEYVCHSL